MTTLLAGMMMVLGSAASTSKNPLKLSVILTLLSGSLFFYSSLATGMSWFPTIFFLLFMGGILMMFMILSSVMPNEPSGKTKLNLAMILPFLLLTLTWGVKIANRHSMTGTKSFLTESMTLEFLMSMLLVYFFFCIFIIKTEKMPMRSTHCQKPLIL